MDIFDDTPRTSAVEAALPRKLDSLSVDALHDYIAELEAEVARVRAEIEKKQGLHQAAEQVFKSE
ncbi:MAG: DUF1192 domain-containing protein [Alphaproteobacteria bacterium]|nr:DUF1192 domain-containing protein [Alphaproteobacteria bacterium]